MSSSFEVISINSKSSITLGKKYEVQRVTMRADGQYYHVIDDVGKKAKYHSGNFKKLEDLEKRDM